MSQLTSRRMMSIWIGVILTLALSGSSWARGGFWVREALRPGIEQRLPKAFELQVVRCDDTHLTGLAVLTRYSSAPIAITGVETEDRRFWPTTTFQISDDLDRGWQTLEKTEITGMRASRRIDPVTSGETLFVNLDGFKAQVGHARYGRIGLENGDTAVFLMKSLQAPLKLASVEKAAHGEPLWNRSLGTLHSSEPIPPLFFLATSCDKDGIEGTFVYGSSVSKPDPEAWALSKGGNVWPTVTAQVANNDRDQWMSIGQSSNPPKAYKTGTPPRDPVLLRVRLNVFEQMIGRYRYGRVVLENGDSAIFELVNLTRPDMQP